MPDQSHAGQVMRRITAGIGTGGGHALAAGGQVPVPADSPTAERRLTRLIRRRSQRLLRVDAKSRRPLLT